MKQPEMKKKILAITLLLLVGQLSLTAQHKRLISGNVIDVKTKEPLPYVTVSLKKQLIGVVTNEEGKFDLYVPEDLINDTLLFNYLGYKHFLVDISTVKEILTVQLEETVVQLEEIVIRPLLPENYIQMAMRKVKENYPGDPFQTVAYYREKMLENKKLLKYDEGVFKTYYPNYLDTVKTQNQLYLFRRAENPGKIEFMSREIKNKEAKDSANTAKGKENNMELDLGESFGGPADILKSEGINKDREDFLDSMQFKSFKYSFAKSSSYNSNELIVIDFATRGKVNHVREKGKIYIDQKSLAIVRIELKGDFIIPGIVKSVFFFASIGIKNPVFEKNTEFEQVNGKWYPKNIQNNIDIILTNNHLFRKDERSVFEIEQFFTVNELRTENFSEVPVEKRFESDKAMEKQVYNDAHLTWEGLNIIKK